MHLAAAVVRDANALGACDALQLWQLSLGCGHDEYVQAVADLNMTICCTIEHVGDDLGHGVQRQIPRFLHVICLISEVNLEDVSTHTARRAEQTWLSRSG